MPPINTMFRDRADALTRAGAKTALQQLRHALQQSQRDGDSDNIAWALLHTAMVLRGQRKLTTIFKILSEAQTLFTGTRNEFGQACVLHELSIANRELGRSTLAADYGEKAA